MKVVNKIKAIDASLAVPGSKSLTQRALSMAALARGTSRLRNCLHSEDTALLGEALRSMGAGMNTAGDVTIVTGTGGLLIAPENALYLGNNGTGMRFLVSICSLANGPTLIDGDERLRQRPLKPLLEALREVGGICESAGPDGNLPVINRGGGIKGGKIAFRDSESSQYISALLIAAPFAAEDLAIELEGRILSRPYIDMTIDVMRRFGASVIEDRSGRRFRVMASRTYESRDYDIEGDASSASYFFLAAALCRGRVRVTNIGDGSLQGDLGFLDILEELGCSVRRGSDFIEVEGRPLREGDITWDLSAMPDMVPGASVLAAFRHGRTVIANVPHLRFKESDRLAAMATELGRIGIVAAETSDGLVIEGGRPRGGAIKTYNDHRIAMSFAVAGLVTGEMAIENENCVQKSFPSFWRVLEDMKG